MKERIIDQTTRMFASHGIKAVRMDDIAAELGISKRTIYEVFGDKESLIMAAVTHFHDTMDAVNAKFTEQSANIIEEYMMLMKVHDKQMDALCKMLDDLKKYYPVLFERWMSEHAVRASNEIRKKLQQGIDEGLLLPDLDIEKTISIVGMSMYNAIRHHILSGRNSTQRETFEFFVTHFMRGIATLRGIELIDKLRK